MSYYIHQKDRLKIMRDSNFESEQIVYGFTTRVGGVSEPPFASLNLGDHVGDDLGMVNINRELLTREILGGNSPLTYANQVHDKEIFVLKDKKDRGFLGDYDGIITNLSNVPIITFYADCIPLIFKDEKKKVIGVVHAGWKGTYLEIGTECLSKMMEEFKSEVSDIEVLIGPGICLKHYEVNEELYLKFKEKFSFYEKFSEIVDGHFYLDLKKCNELILKSQGIELVYNQDLCTSCKNDLFFSYRAENGKTGRFGAFAMLKE